MPPNVQLLRSFQNRNNTLRLDSRNGSDTNVAGYVHNDETLAIAGDKDAPYGKYPPFPSEFTELGFIDPLTATHVPEDSIFALYPVESFRTFTLCVEYTPRVVAAVLSLVVYNVIPSNAANYVGAQYFPIAFVAPTSVSALVGGFTQPFSTRVVQPEALITIASTAGLQTIRFAVSFDVSPYSVIGMTAAETLATHGSVRLFGNSNT